MSRLRRLLVPILALTALTALPAVGVAVISDSAGVSPPSVLSDLLTSYTGINGLNNANMFAGQALVLTTPPNIKPSFTSATVTNRMSILYATDPSVRDILAGSSQMPGLPWLFRQEPSNSGPGARLGVDNSQRMTKLNGASLAKMTSSQMFDALWKGVNRSCVTPAGINTCPAHLVAVDEIGAAFGRVEGDQGVNVPGYRLKSAMETLAQIQSPWGGSYASRIHFYLAPGVSTAIAAGKGPAHNLGADGKVHWPDYSSLIDAFTTAGGVWLEMYHYPTRGSARTPFTSTEWRTVPTAVAAFMAERGIEYPLQSLHFVMTETAGNDLVSSGQCLAERVAGDSKEHANRVGASATAIDFPACGPRVNVCISSRASNERHSEMSMRGVTPSMNNVIRGAANQIIPVDSGIQEFPVQQASPSGMACQWQRAQTGDVNLRILMNGPAAFRATGTEAIVFGQLFRQFFIVS
ncbi:MAG: hypothetical protein NT143_00395 [Actinobacteria bacterium]|nr:hypothetical protein [Actinomycetota bacterium]